MKTMARGQFFSADFVVAVVCVCFALGVLLHSGQLAFDGLGQYAMHENNVADAVAESLAGDAGISVDAARIPNTCWQYDNGTSSSPDCNIIINGVDGCLANKREVFAAQRFVACQDEEDRACLLTVRSCEMLLG